MKKLVYAIALPFLVLYCCKSTTVGLSEEPIFWVYARYYNTFSGNKLLLSIDTIWEGNETHLQTVITDDTVKYFVNYQGEIFDVYKLDYPSASYMSPLILHPINLEDSIVNYIIYERFYKCVSVDSLIEVNGHILPAYVFQSDATKDVNEEHVYAKNIIFYHPNIGEVLSLYFDDFGFQLDSTVLVDTNLPYFQNLKK